MTDNNRQTELTSQDRPLDVKLKAGEGLAIPEYQMTLQLFTPEEMARGEEFWSPDSYCAYVWGPCKGTRLVVRIRLSANLINDEHVNLVAFLIEEFANVCLDTEPPKESTND